MTLAEVATKMKEEAAGLTGGPIAQIDPGLYARSAVDYALKAFEEDPDFKLGDRVRERIAGLKARQENPKRNPDWDTLRMHLIAELETLLNPPLPGLPYDRPRWPVKEDP